MMLKKNWKKWFRKEWKSILLSFGLAVFLFILMEPPAILSNEIKTQKGESYVAYPESLKERDLYFDTLHMLSVPKGESYISFPLSDATRMRYLGSLEQATQDTLTSSVTEYLPVGKGLSVQVLTPEKIQISAKHYRNALLTAGILDANVRIASTEQTMGSNALLGVFLPTVEKQEDVLRIQLAQDELELLNHLTLRYPLDEGELKWNIAFLKMKQQVARYKGKASELTIHTIIYESFPSSIFPVLKERDEENIYRLLAAYQQTKVVNNQDVQQAFKKYEKTLLKELSQTNEAVLEEETGWNMNAFFNPYGWLTE